MIRAFLFMVAASLGLAQMGGPGMGMGGSNSGDPNQGYMRMFLGMGSNGMMGSGMGFGMTGDLAVGTDGTAYMLRPVSSSSTAPSVQYELDAISPSNGNTLWRLQIPGGRISQPVLTTDGLILLTVDNYEMFEANRLTGTMMNRAQGQSTGSHLLVISHTASSASIQVTIPIASDILSEPFIATDPNGGYLIYVVGYNIMAAQSSSSSTFSFGNKTLYAFKSGGVQRFSISLQ